MQNNQSHILALELFFKHDEFFRTVGNLSNFETNRSKFSKNFAYVANVKLNDTNIILSIQNLNISDDLHEIHIKQGFTLKHFVWINDFLVYIITNCTNLTDKIFIFNNLNKITLDISPINNAQFKILKYLSNTNEIILAINTNINASIDLYILNLNSYACKLSLSNTCDIIDWLIDENGLIKARLKINNETVTIEYRDSIDANFTPIYSFTNMYLLYPSSEIKLCGIDKINNNLLILLRNEFDTLRLVEFNPKRQEISKTLFFHEKVDIKNVIFYEDTLFAIEYETHKINYYFFDSKYTKIYAYIQKLLPNYSIKISAIANNKINVFAFNEVNRGIEFLFDCNSNELNLIIEYAPWLNNQPLSHMQCIQFTTTDGIKLDGYLTIPSQITQNNLPLIVNPHPGPFFMRNSWEYNPETQFLANRGYVVLQINMRGSGGYGKKFCNLGLKTSHTLMLQDLVDAIHYVLQLNIFNPKKIAIFGHSYGGNAALMSLIKYPDIYKLGICYNGPINLVRQAKEPNLPNFIKSAFGDILIDKQVLQDASPYFQINKMNKPILIVTGKLDLMDNPKFTNEFVTNVKKLNPHIKQIVMKNEGHYFLHMKNILTLYKEIENFLLKYL